MYFYVYVQPDVFVEANSDGGDAPTNLLGILRCFYQNCFLAAFEDGRWELQVKRAIEDWPEDMARKRIVSLLVRMKKSKRLLNCLAPDYLDLKPDLDCVCEQAPSIFLDLLLVVASEVSRCMGNGPEVTSRRTYHMSDFEEHRTDVAAHGSTVCAGEMAEIQFMDIHFRKAVRYAQQIHICDKFCGTSNFSQNFQYTVEQFLAWLSTALHEPQKCRIVFHFGQPAGLGDQHVIQKLGQYRHNHLSTTPVDICFYSGLTPDDVLPHQRFILTDQVALNIERGLDFLNESTQTCRETLVNYEKRAVAENFLSRYFGGRSTPISV